MPDTYLSEVANDPIGWGPVVGLLFFGLSSMIVLRFFLWIWKSRPNTPGLDQMRQVVIPASAPYWPAQRPSPVLVGTPFAPPMAEVEHIGAEEWQAHELKPLAPLDDSAKAALTTETAEFVIVWDDTQQQVVAETETDQGVVGVELAYPIEPEYLPATREDELGVWDPDAVDWLEPAVYVEALEFSLKRRPYVLSNADRAYLAYTLRREALALADSVMTGA